MDSGIDLARIAFVNNLARQISQSWDLGRALHLPEVIVTSEPTEEDNAATPEHDDICVVNSRRRPVRGSSKAIITPEKTTAPQRH